MAEEVVEVATLAADVPSELKRKLEEVEGEQDEHQEQQEHDSDTISKRLRLADEPQVSASENGHQDDSSKVVNGTGDADADADGDGDGGKPPAEADAEAVEAQLQPQGENHQQTEETVANESAPENIISNTDIETNINDDNSQNDKVGTKEEEAVVTESVTEVGDAPTSVDPQNMSRKIQVPNNKVGVLIGKGGDTIRYLQYNSGAKIQIMRDAEADMSNPTRPVELIGTVESINKAEKLIRDVIAEADAGGSPSLVARGIATSQVGATAEQVEIKVPNEKVGLIIGRGGDTIKGLQTRSGARIQLIPQHLPEGDESKERIIRVSGDKRQIDIATDMIKDVMRQKHSPLSGGFSQPFRPRGPSGPSQWGPRPYHGQQMGYDYQQRAPYPSQNPQYPPPPYGGFPNQQAGPRSGYGSVWEQRPPTMQGQAHHGGGYDYYGGLGGQAQVSAPHSAQMSGHPGGQPAGHGVGPVRAQVNYNYGPSQGPDYGHPGPYPQAGHPQQNYGQGYDGASMQHSYGGHGSSQPAYSQGAQSGYSQQYGKPPAYGMPQSYAPPRANQPGDIPYQGSSQPAQTYGSSMPPSQVAYSYPMSGPMQQTYPQTYSTAPTADAYNQQPTASGAAGYQQPGSQPVPVYGQSDGQVQSYGQAGATAGYASYPPGQQGYPEQAAAANNASYVYQQPQDATYGGTQGSAYTAAPNSQPGYTQQPPAQASYDQSIPQSGGYSSVPASAPTAVAPAGYVKTVSPQPSYPQQYDSAQAYGASR